MKARVTARGLHIPKALLEGFDEVEIQQEAQRITIVPIAGDPIRKLGLHPVAIEETQAAERHDDLLYPV